MNDRFAHRDVREHDRQFLRQQAICQFSNCKPLDDIRLIWRRASSAARKGRVRPRIGSDRQIRGPTSWLSGRRDRNDRAPSLGHLGEQAQLGAIIAITSGAVWRYANHRTAHRFHRRNGLVIGAFHFHRRMALVRHESGTMSKHNRRFKLPPLKDRFASFIKINKERILRLPPGPEREALVRKVHEAEAITRLDRWVNSDGLRRPT